MDIDYQKFERDALSLLEDYGFVEFPIDVFALAKKAFNVKFIKFSSLSQEDIEKLKNEYNISDGFTFIDYDSNERIIYYDDKVTYARQRFTIAHEIKHLFYNERISSEKCEKEADYFAKCLLASKCLIIKYNMKSENEIATNFELSLEASEYHLRGINNRRKRYGCLLETYEKEFLANNKVILKKIE